MGVMDAMKEKMDEEERKIIRDIVKALPLVPDQARLCVAAYARPLAPGWRSCVLGYARCGARRALGSLGCTRQRAAHVYNGGGLALCRNCTLGAPRLLSRGSRAAVCGLWRRARARWRCGSLPRREEGHASAKCPLGHAPRPQRSPAALWRSVSAQYVPMRPRPQHAVPLRPGCGVWDSARAPYSTLFACQPVPEPRRLRAQLAYWWCVHAGALNCGPDREHVEKELILNHKKL